MRWSALALFDTKKSPLALALQAIEDGFYLKPNKYKRLQLFFYFFMPCLLHDQPESLVIARHACTGMHKNLK